MDIKAEVIDSGDYIGLRVRQSAILSNRIECSFLRKAQQMLQHEPFSMKAKFIDVAAADVIIRGKRIFENVEECDESEEVVQRKKQGKEKLYRLSDRYRNALDEAVLLLKLTNCGNRQVEQCDATAVSPVVGQQQQKAAYRHLFPSISHPSATVAVKTFDVTDFASMMKTISDFVTQSAVKAKRALVIFQGSIEKDRLQITQSLSKPFQIVLDFIGSCYAENFREHLLPAEIDIAYQEAMPSGKSLQLLPCVHVLNMSHTPTMECSWKHYSVQLNSDSVFSSRFEPAASVQAGSHSNPMFQVRQYASPELQTMPSSILTSQAQNVKPTTRTWSEDSLAGYDTVD